MLDTNGSRLLRWDAEPVSAGDIPNCVEPTLIVGDTRATQTERMSLVLRGAVALLLASAAFAVHTADDDPVEPAVATVASASVKSGPASALAPCIGTAKEPGGPDPWGGCWPGPHNTGVPAGTRLTAYSGDRTVSTPGAVIDGWDVDGCILVTALGVTIQNSRAHCVVVAERARYCHAGESAAERSLTECTMVAGLSTDQRAKQPVLTIRDSEIRCPEGLGESGIADRNVVVERVDISNCENGFSVDSHVKVRHSYIHDLYNAVEGDPHTDGLQGLVGRNLRLVHNVFYAFTTGCSYPSVDARCNGNAAITIGGQREWASVRHNLIRRNLLAGGSYTLYCPFVTPAGFSIVENRFSEVYSPKVGEYGPMTGCRGPGITKRGNKRIRY